jgi:SAM-dependent methyltransferase
MQQSNAVTLPSMTRICPLLDAPSKTQTLPWAAAPWVAKQCLETQFVYLENPPAYEALREDFAWQNTSEAAYARRKNAEPLRYFLSGLIKKVRREYLQRDKVLDLSKNALVSMAKNRSTPLTFVDVGCGWGTGLKALHKSLNVDLAKRAIPVGLEISDELAKITAAALLDLHPHAQCIRGPATFGMSQFKAKSVSLVVMSSFLEHEVEPITLLKMARNALEENGQIIIKVPNYDCWNRRLRGAKWSGFRWPDHVNYFTPVTLQLAIEKAGLKVMRMKWVDRQPTSDSLYAIAQRSA